MKVRQTRRTATVRIADLDKEISAAQSQLSAFLYSVHSLPCDGRSRAGEGENDHLKEQR